MAITVLSDVGLWLGKLDLRGVTNQIAAEMQRNLPDATTFGDLWQGTALGGKGLDVEYSGYFDPAVDAGLHDAVPSGAVLTVAPDGIAAGDPAYAFECETGSLRRSGQWGELFRYEMSAQGMKAARPIRGRLALVDAEVDANGGGSALELGALGSGAHIFAAVHILAAEGTTPGITFRVESDNASSFGSPTTRGTFQAMSAAGSQWLTPIAGPIATDTWWRIAWTLSGTSPSFDAVAVLALI